jgi:hypothetical protein
MVTETDFERLLSRETAQSLFEKSTIEELEEALHEIVYRAEEFGRIEAKSEVVRSFDKWLEGVTFAEDAFRRPGRP